MLTAKSVAAFAVKFLLAYGALSASRGVTGGAYALFLGETGRWLFALILAPEDLQVRSVVEGNDANDLVLSIRVATGGRALTVTSSTWLIGFQPTSILIALVLASPVPWRRRCGALLSGITMVHAFVLVRLLAFYLLADLEVLDNFWTRALRQFAFDFIHGHALSCFLPVLIWLVVTVRSGDFRVFSTPSRPTD